MDTRGVTFQTGEIRNVLSPAESSLEEPHIDLQRRKGTVDELWSRLLSSLFSVFWKISRNGVVGRGGGRRHSFRSDLQEVDYHSEEHHSL